MITIEKLNPKSFELTDEQRENLELLCPLLTEIEARAKCGDFVVTNGFRSLQDHLRIYHQINERRLKQNLFVVSVPMGSQHLKGNAADIADPKKELQAYLLTEPGLESLEELGLYCERFDYTSQPNPWVHFQRVAPVSNKRFFRPF